MGDTKFGALVILVLIGVTVGVLPAAMADGASETTVTDEELTVDYDAESSVAESGDFYSEIVEIDNAGTTLEAGTDYTWNNEIGNVTWIDTTATTEGDTVAINYSAFDIDQEADGIAALVSLFQVPLALLGLLVLGGTVWQGVKS